MGAFLSYSIVSGMLLLAMFAAYRLFMAGDNRHSWNRGVLLSIYALSFLSLPLIGLLRSLLPSTASAAPAVEGAIEATVEVLPVAAPAWGRALIWIFIAGMAITSLRTIMTWARIIRVISKGERIRKKGYTLVLTGNNGMAPFSWMHYMVMSRDDHASCPDAITVHELRHITCRHWIDLLVAQAVTIINWFNPAAWLMRSQLMLVHEYQADMAVIDRRYNPKEYQLLLIRKAVGAKFPCLANSLNHSKLKKRVNMMYKKNPSTGRRMLSLALVPALWVALFSINIPAVGALIREASVAEVPFPDGKGSEKSVKGKISISPDANKSSENRITGKELENKTVYIDGKKATVNEMQALDPEKIASMTVLKAKDSDEIHITTKDTASGTEQALQSSPDREVQLQAQEMPRFPGGEAELMKYVAMNLKYPQEAMNAGKEGRVVIRFVVSADGKVKDPQVVRSVDKQLDDEALRVISSLPDFIPGKIDGKPVSVWYTMPVSFRLSKDKPAK